ncbi:uncharacterized protein LOC121396875 isoform X1 [Xenopus laevis]|uniref:Uncharacterized protein LOC121396875 isoform X1 n=1 Tax=Xenopus laevis TaxID=8355 RepID=A0A8J1LG94_XENLA|nr:uncharacterized protein LOC121396875 isoform X1 [Xenopus laevis]
MLYLLCLAPNLPQPTWRAVDIRQDKYGGAHVVISAGWRYQDGGGSKVAQTRFNQELGSQSGLHLVTPGDTITTDTGFMRCNRRDGRWKLIVVWTLCYYFLLLIFLVAN